MSNLLYNFFPTDFLHPHQLPVNGYRTQKQVVTQKTVTCEGTLNCNFFPNDLLPPFQLPVGRDMTAETVHETTAPAQGGNIKFKGAALQTEQVHSKKDSSPVLSSRRTTPFSASRDVPNIF